MAPKSKRPQGVHWTVLTGENIAAIKKHLESGGNIGLVCGPDSGVAVLDFDKEGALAEMSQELGVPTPWVETGSGKLHCYVQWEESLPARILWRDERVGEIQRGPSLQHVVIPPSVHPDTNRPYKWLLDPRTSIPDPLLPSWREYLGGHEIPSYIVQEAIGHPDDIPWDGPPVAEILQRALSQPGAKRRRFGIKFQCPGCRAEGHDRSRDNAIVYDDGRWGCAVSRDHTRDIGEELGYSLADSNLAKELVSDSDVTSILNRLR